MNSSSRELRNFIATVYDFQNKKTEKDGNHLLRQLQILSMINDLQIFEPTSMEAVEFYVCLENLLGYLDEKSVITWKIINLLNHICKSATIRIALRDNIQLLPILTDILIASHSSYDKTTKTLTVMQDISYGIKITISFMWVQKLIPHLVNLIKSHDNSDIILMAFTTLNNLCRKSPMCVTIFQKSAINKQFIEAIIHHKNASLHLRLLATEVMLFLQFNQKDLANEITRIIGLLFKASIEVQDVQILQLASDILEGMSSSCAAHEGVRQYKEIGPNIIAIIRRIQDGASSTLVACVMNIICQVIKLDHPEINEHVDLIITKTLPWMYDEECGLCAITLIETIYEYMNENTFLKHQNALISAVKSSIINEDSQICSKQLHRLNAMLKLVQEFCNKDPSFKLNFGMNVGLEDFLVILRRLLSASSSDFAAVQDVKNNLMVNTLPCTASPYESIREAESFVQGYVNNCSSQESYATENMVQSLQELCSQVIVRVLVICKMAAKQKDALPEYIKMLTLPGVMNHIVTCCDSKSPVLVNLAFRILCDDQIPTESQSNLKQAKMMSNSLTLDTKRDSMIKDLSQVRFAQQSLDAIEDHSMKFIEKLQKFRIENELQNLPLTDIIDMYELNLASKAHELRFLQNALTSAETTNRQLNLSILQNKTESERLRYILQTWEKNMTEERNKTASMKSEVERIQSQAAEQRNTLLMKHVNAEKKYDELKSKMINVQRELTQKVDEIGNYSKLLSESQQENKKLHSIIKEEKESFQKLQEEGRKQQRELENMEKDNKKYEKHQVQLKTKITELENYVNTQEQTIAEKESQIEELNKNCQALKRIQDMIHNISSGKS